MQINEVIVILFTRVRVASTGLPTVFPFALPLSSREGVCPRPLFLSRKRRHGEASALLSSARSLDDSRTKDRLVTCRER